MADYSRPMPRWRFHTDFCIEMLFSVYFSVNRTAIGD
jgi:hypothetical protein